MMLLFADTLLCQLTRLNKQGDTEARTLLCKTFPQHFLSIIQNKPKPKL
jgi:hypothetical protein